MAFERAKAALIDTRFADLRWVPETGSTNADMEGLLARPDPGASPEGAVVLLAGHQKAGRGRLDRAWVAPAGASILMTIGLPLVGFPAPRRTLLTAALALSVTDAAPDLRIKWPNDLVAVGVGSDGGDRKVGGILAEVHPIPARGDCVLLGLGLNLNWPGIPDDLAAVATSLNLCRGVEVDPDAVAADLLSALDSRWLAPLESTSPSIDALLEAYRDRSATLGRPVRVELPGGELLGTARDVDDRGALVVEDDRGARHTVTVGDVVHLRPTD